LAELIKAEQRFVRKAFSNQSRMAFDVDAELIGAIKNSVTELSESLGFNRIADLCGSNTSYEGMRLEADGRQARIFSFN
jgi:hypothetical protein